MSIWKTHVTVEQANEATNNNLMSLLGIRFTEIGDNFVQATMPVDERTKQPMGLLSGGASVVLAESIGSFASLLAVEQGHYTVGLDINANHLRGVTSGLVTAIAQPIHIGRSTHVWGIEITDDRDKKVCVARLTMSVLKA